MWRRSSVASTNKSLAQINKSPDVGKATKGCLALPVTQSGRAELLTLDPLC
jgi:hypothetical protein